MNYAIIVDGKVERIVELERRNAQDFPNAVWCDRFPLNVGDEYKDGKFMRDGKEILTYELQYMEDQKTLANGFKELKEYKENLIVLNEYVVQMELDKAMAGIK